MLLCAAGFLPRPVSCLPYFILCPPLGKQAAPHPPSQVGLALGETRESGTGRAGTRVTFHLSFSLAPSLLPPSILPDLEGGSLTNHIPFILMAPGCGSLPGGTPSGVQWEKGQAGRPVSLFCRSSSPSSSTPSPLLVLQTDRARAPKCISLSVHERNPPLPPHHTHHYHHQTRMGFF